ncbi:phosphoenolpyruvate--protein phosphotransferase [Gammaproteobacteria bacterium SCGC AG-212-F23]|nr:phosphoenolpyruvate--protein phosphotransferase [Gammaproteobacteria bacterium SCGC AG-212-F23]
MLKALRQIIQTMLAQPDFKEALQLMVQHVVDLLQTDACSLYLLDKQRGEYRLVAAQGLNPDAIMKVSVPVHQGLIGWVGEREEPVNLENANQHPQFLSIPLLQEENYKAFLGVPIIYHRRVFGVLIVQQRTANCFDESTEAFLVTLAVQLAPVIASADASGKMAVLLENQHSYTEEARYAGIPGAPGIGIGTGVAIYPLLELDAVPDRKIEDIDAEIHLLEIAFAASRKDVRLLAERISPNLPVEERSLFDVYQRMLDSADLGAEMIHLIRKGNWAPGALRVVIQSHVNRLENSDNIYLRERAIDIKDLGLRILSYLQNNPRHLPNYPEKTILVGEALTAVDLAEVPEGCLVGMVSVKGSRNSHVAILARAMGVPTIMGVENLSVHELNAKEMIIDGYYGQIYVSPMSKLRKKFERLLTEERELNESLEVLRDQPADTADGKHVTLLVNTGLGADVGLALAAGAEGVGLYRTETPFLMRDRFPSGEEQRVIYRQLLASFAPRPVTMRTLDVGGDKVLSYFPVLEENPFLGWRGLRISLDHPEIFLVQLRAMLRASEKYHNLRIMLPMVTDVSEVDEALRLFKKACQEVMTEDVNIKIPAIGVMIEVPSAVSAAGAIAKRVDFLSVGSNDLTQYILAVDRNNARVANLYDALHPAVLRALLQVVESAHQENKPVSICGEIAGDPSAVPLLIAMGFDSLSMNASALMRTKCVVRKLTMDIAKTLLQEVLMMESAVTIRCHMELALKKLGLEHIIRVGKR